MMTGKATKLESQFRLTYSMILNLLRVEDLKVLSALLRAVPCCAMPWCAVLCCAVLCRAVSCCAVLCRAVLPTALGTATSYMVTVTVASPLAYPPIPAASHASAVAPLCDQGLRPAAALNRVPRTVLNSDTAFST